MEQYILKSAIVAEIERLKNELSPNFYEYDYDAAKVELLDKIENLIDTLEVKENDLVEEIDYDDYVRFFKEHPEYNDGSWGFEETWTFAQYCYKLGLQSAQKGE